MRTPVLILLCLTSLLVSCANERIVEKPVVVEVIKTEIQPVPDDLLIRHIKTTIPESLTYGEAVMLWAEDRRIIDVQNGQLAGIATLGEEHD